MWNLLAHINWMYYVVAVAIVCMAIGGVKTWLNWRALEASE